MININQGQANTVVLTLSEKTTLSTPYYLFKFENAQATSIQKLFNATDTFCDTTRCSKFTITEDATEDLDNGTVELAYAGQWFYTIYEVSTATEKNPDNATATLETGYVTVFDTETAITAYEPTITEGVYEPND